MDLVLRLEEHRGVQPAGLLSGPDCGRHRTGTGKKSRSGHHPAENPEVFFQGTTQRLGESNPVIKEFLDGGDPEQEGSPTQSKTPHQKAKAREVVHGL